MTKRFKINAFAAAVIAAGSISLLASPARAETAVDGCASMMAARMQAYETCASLGGTGFSSTGSCSSSGYTLSTTCYFD